MKDILELLLNFNSEQSLILLLFLIGIVVMTYVIIFIKLPKWKKRQQSIRRRYKHLSRRNYYRQIYLNSDAWRRKRYVVLKRDNWKCLHCGAPATQVHHTRYAKYNIGKEPIEWLESVCKKCHEAIHN